MFILGNKKLRVTITPPPPPGLIGLKIPQGNDTLSDKIGDDFSKGGKDNHETKVKVKQIS